MGDYRKCRRCGSIVSGDELVETENGHKACPHCGSTILNVISIRGFREKLASKSKGAEEPSQAVEETRPRRRPVKKKSKYLLE